jgi:hypothetical protein
MGLLSFLFGCEKRDSTEPEVTASEYQQEDAYRDLRRMAFELKAEDISLSDKTNQPLVVLMEMGTPKAVVTLLTSADGAASIYFSSGGGFIGAGEHDSVREVSLSFLELASDFKSELTKTDAYPLPKLGSVRFYLITANGVFTAEKREDDLGNLRESLSPLFHKGHEVITAIRLASQTQ